jgi:AcrR family transcriptional regulator
VSRRRASVDLGAVVAALGAPAVVDEQGGRILDAAESLLRSAGLRAWAVEDVAATSGVARSTVYRLFGGRDELVHAVLARELRSVLDAVAAAVDGGTGLEDKAVAAIAVCLGSLEGSVVDALLRLDPATFLPYLTTGAGPLVALAREAIATIVEADSGRRPPAAMAEVCARMGLSYVLTRETVLPVGDPEALRREVRQAIGPMVAALRP